MLKWVTKKSQTQNQKFKKDNPTNLEYRSSEGAITSDGNSNGKLKTKSKHANPSNKEEKEKEKFNFLGNQTELAKERERT